jgi:hypothetical protein
MVLTRRSIISQPNRVYTRSCSSLVLVLFLLSENNTRSYFSIDRRSGFCRVCYLWAIYFILSTGMVFTYFPSSFFGLISSFQKVSPVNANYITTVSSSSPSTPCWSGNHPPFTPDSEKTIPLPSPLQRLLDWYIAVHRRKSQQSPSDENVQVMFGFQCIHHVKTLSLQFTGWAGKVGILMTGKPPTQKVCMWISGKLCLVCGLWYFVLLCCIIKFCWFMFSIVQF